MGQDVESTGGRGGQEDVQSASQVLLRLMREMDGRKDLSVRELVQCMGEQGQLMVCAMLSLPFLLPVSLPGVSTVFGLAILLIGLSLLGGRALWLPAKVADRRLDAARLRAVLARGQGLLQRVDAWLRPQRLAALSTGAAMQRVNALGLVLAAVLLMLPLGLVPLSNTLPGIAILLLSLGMTQRDGALVLAGHGMWLGSLAYFCVLGWLAWQAGGRLLG